MTKTGFKSVQDECNNLPLWLHSINNQAPLAKINAFKYYFVPGLYCKSMYPYHVHIQYLMDTLHINTDLSHYKWHILIVNSVVYSGASGRVWSMCDLLWSDT